MIKSILIFTMCVTILVCIGGVSATWFYSNLNPQDTQMEISLDLNNFIYYQPEMPEGEVSVLERLSKILNQEYTTDTITDSRKYLIEETIRVEWDPGAAPYVGSMDPDFQTQINELFGDIIDLNEVSFILKNEDLNGDYYNEIAMYSTSDHLDWSPNHQGIVGVYLTVFTPIIDDEGNIVKYELLCDSIHGYCIEVNYHSSDTRPSFSTDHWVDELSYWHHEIPYLRPIPEEDRYDAENYHTYHYAYENCPYPGWIEFTGKTAEQRLSEIFANLQ